MRPRLARSRHAGGRAALVGVLALSAALAGCVAPAGSGGGPSAATSGVTRTPSLSPTATPPPATPTPSIPGAPAPAPHPTSPGAGTPAPVTPTASPTPTPSGPSTATVLAREIAGTAAADPNHFRGRVTHVGFDSPSGNITCGFRDNGGVVCQLGSFSFRAPVECHGAGSGGAILLEPGLGPMFACMGDVESGGPTLPYGSHLSVRDVTCASRQDGVTCRTRAGAGFRVARLSYLLAPAAPAGS